MAKPKASSETKDNQKESPKVQTATEKKSTDKAKKPSVKKAIIATLTLLLWVGVVVYACEYIVAFGMYFLLGYERLQTPVWTTVANALIYALATFLIIWIPVKYFKQRKMTREQLGLQGLPTWLDMLSAPIAFVIYFILAGIFIVIFSNFSFFDAEQAQELGYHLTNGFDRVLAFFALCIIAPIAEEIIFRGWLYGKLRKIIPGKKLSLFLSILLVSILFGFLHGQWNVGVNVFAMSIVLCALREFTGTIYAGILLHILKNTVAFALVYVLGLS